MKAEINKQNLDRNLTQVLAEIMDEEFGIDTKQPAVCEAVRSLSTALQHLPGNMRIEDVQRLIHRTLSSDGEGGVLHDDEFAQLSQTEKIRRLQASSQIIGAIADVRSQLD